MVNGLADLLRKEFGRVQSHRYGPLQCLKRSTTNGSVRVPDLKDAKINNSQLIHELVCDFVHVGRLGPRYGHIREFIPPRFRFWFGTSQIVWPRFFLGVNHLFIDGRHSLNEGEYDRI